MTPMTDMNTQNIHPILLIFPFCSSYKPSCSLQG
jgi:hypothetical protein